MLTGIAKFPLSESAWTPINAPFDCSYFLIIGNEDNSGNRIDEPMIRCSDENNVPATQYTMKMDDWFGLVVPARFGAYRFIAGSPVTFLKATVSPQVAIVEFYQ